MSTRHILFYDLNIGFKHEHIDLYISYAFQRVFSPPQLGVGQEHSLHHAITLRPQEMKGTTLRGANGVFVGADSVRF